jgi:hypothetical protein
MELLIPIYSCDAIYYFFDENENIFNSLSKELQLLLCSYIKYKNTKYTNQEYLNNIIEKINIELK